MLAAIRQFDDGMRARVRAHDGEHSGFYVTEGLRQGCVWSFQLGRRHREGLRSPRFEEDVLAGKHVSLACAPRAVWGIAVILTLTHRCNAVRGHRTGSNNSGAENYLRRKTNKNRR